MPAQYGKNRVLVMGARPQHLIVLTLDRRLQIPLLSLPFLKSIDQVQQMRPTFLLPLPITRRPLQKQRAAHRSLYHR